MRGEAVIQLLRSLYPADGLVVVLEDLHWADPDTIAVVEYLTDNVQAEHVLCIVTIRTEPPSPAADLARRQRGRVGISHLQLDRLDAAETALMARACSPAVTTEMIALVQQMAEGVPLLIEDVLASPGIPSSFADTVRERLAGFSPDARLAIEAAAVLGRLFDWELLPTMTGLTAQMVSDSLARAVDCLLLKVDGGSFRFRHALTREAVLAALLPPRQQALAAAGLAALEQARPQFADARADLAADLAVRSDDRHRGGAMLAASGTAALDRGALETAIGTLRQAAGLLDGDKRGVDAEVSLVAALALAGRVDEAAAAASRLAARLGDDPASLLSRVEVHLRLAQAAVAAARWLMASHHIESAHNLLGTHRLPGVAARIAVLDAEVAFAAGDLVRAHRLADSVLSDGGSAEVRCHALEIIGRGQRLRDLAAARSAFEQALATAETAGLRYWRLRALHELGTIDMFDHLGFERLTEAHGVAGELGALSTAAVIELQLTALFYGRRALEESARHARSALAIAEQLRLDQVRAVALCQIAAVCALQGNAEEAEHYRALSLAAAPSEVSDQRRRSPCLTIRFRRSRRSSRPTSTGSTRATPTASWPSAPTTPS